MTMESPLRVLSTPWCPYCRILKRFLDDRSIPYEEFDIESDEAAMAEINGLQSGGRTVPTVVYPDGTHDVNPSGARLLERLGIAA
ncbi:MAG: glutaredoxin domain-containing protein [Chloroflexi bacterium]|nr:glutaredoxin domain-containing protein [Chloroflexota bacterium]